MFLYHFTVSLQEGWDVASEVLAVPRTQQKFNKMLGGHLRSFSHVPEKDTLREGM